MATCFLLKKDSESTLEIFLKRLHRITASRCVREVLEKHIFKVIVHSYQRKSFTFNVSYLKCFDEHKSTLKKTTTRQKENQSNNGVGDLSKRLFSFFGPRISAVGHDYKHGGPR